MKKMIKLLTIFMPVIMIICLITGCTKNTITPKPETVYFQRGVYKTFSPDNTYIDYYVFMTKIQDTQRIASKV